MRRLASMAFCAAAALATAASFTAQAAVTRDQFPPRTTGDLISLCSAGREDPLMTAAVNFCQGFAEGAVELALGYQTVTRHDRQPFCLPTPRPSHDEALARFTEWAKAEPKRLDEPPVTGLMRFLVHQYPCLHAATSRGTGK